MRLDDAVKPKNIFAWLAVFATLRAVFDQTLIYGFGPGLTNSLLSHIHMFMYLFILFLCIPYIAFLLTGKIKELDRSAVADVYSRTVMIWVIINPSVPIVSWIFHTPYRATIKWLAAIPTFMPTNNYFPAGMMFVIPIILVYYTYIIHKYLNLSLLKSFLVVQGASIILYLLFYQYILWPTYYLWWHYNFHLFLGVYGLISIAIAVPALLYFMQIFPGERKRWLGYFTGKSVVFLLFAIYGLAKALWIR